MVDFHGAKFAGFCAAVAKLKLVAARKGATMVELATGAAAAAAAVAGGRSGGWAVPR